MTFSTVDYLQVQRVRTFLQKNIDALLDRFDVIAAPGQAETAMPFSAPPKATTANVRSTASSRTPSPVCAGCRPSPCRAVSAATSFRSAFNPRACAERRRRHRGGTPLSDALRLAHATSATGVARVPNTVYPPHARSAASVNGRVRTLLPVAANRALATAGATNGTGCSPNPPGASPLSRRTVSSSGIRPMRST